MYLSGLIKDINEILRAADTLQADSIHFISPNRVFILAKNKQDYFYAHTNLLIGQSVLIPKSSYMNMKLYMSNAIRSRKNKQSIFYEKEIQSVLFSDDKMVFNDDNDLNIEIDIPVFILKKDVEFKLEETIQSGYSSDSPFLRMGSEDFKRLIKEMNRYKLPHDGLLKKNSYNTIRIEENQLVLYREHREINIRFETDIRKFVLNHQFSHEPFVFSDHSLYLTAWLNKSMYLEEIVFLPRKGYCVIEGHSSGLVTKVRTMLKNDI